MTVLLAGVARLATDDILVVLIDANHHRALADSPWFLREWLVVEVGEGLQSRCSGAFVVLFLSLALRLNLALRLKVRIVDEIVELARVDCLKLGIRKRSSC